MLFNKDNLIYSGGYLHYVDPEGKQKFVARFKHMPSSKGTFITFLIKNFTVEEFFDRSDAEEAPLEILQSKGYLLPHIKKVLKSVGYPVSPDGYEQYLKNIVYS